MKKLIFLLLIMTICCSKIAFATDNITVHISYDESADSILVSGTINDQRGTIPLTLEVQDSNNQFVAGFQTIATENDDGQIIYKFESIRFPYTAPSGTYTFIVSGHFVDSAASATYNYYSMSDLLTLLTSINNAVSGSSASLYDIVAQNVYQIDLASEELQALDANARNIFSIVMGEKIYTLPSATDTTNVRMEQIKASYLELRQHAAKALKIAKFTNISSQATLTAWLNQYYTAHGFGKDSDVTAESEAAINVYVNLIKTNTEFVNRISDENSLTDLVDIQKVIYKWALLTTIYTQNDYNTCNIIEKFPTFFPINSTLSKEKKADIYRSIARKYYVSYQEVVDAFYATVNKIYGSNGPDSNSGSDTKTNTWGNSNGSSVSISGTSTSGKTEETILATPKFNDLSGKEWVNDAITYLCDKGIITGKGDGNFAPNDFITRAEFIKILVVASKVSLDETVRSSFSDVPADAWYASYVVAAETAHLVFGNESGQFLPNAHITRQDMVVLLYRAFGCEEGTGNLPFADVDSINDYARIAVNSFFQKGIIKGIGENLFGPLDNATRAQAAQMVYKVLIK